VTRHRGGCHCGDVAFEVEAAAVLTVQECNCSICSMTGFQHLIVPASRFHLLRGAESLTTYTFNTGTARHLFCRRCGIKSFYVPARIRRLHINAAASILQRQLVVEPF
jgi:hypothetical protein